MAEMSLAFRNLMWRGEWILPSVTPLLGQNKSTLPLTHCVGP